MSLRLSGGRLLRSPPGSLTRPTAARVRLAVFNRLAGRLAGARWLDLCCGSGVMACEALQHGAAEVVGVERDRRIAAVARQNLERVARGLQAAAGSEALVDGDPEATSGAKAGGDVAPRWRVDALEVCRWLGRCRDTTSGRETASGRQTDSGRENGSGRDTGISRDIPFDLIYLDPPYGAGLHLPITEAVAAGGWLQPGGQLLWECASDAVPEAPAGWRARDQRRYGSTTLVLLEQNGVGSEYSR